VIGFAKQHVAAQPITWLEVPAKWLVTSLYWRVSGFYQRSVWCWFGMWTAVLGVTAVLPHFGCRPLVYWPDNKCFK